MGRIILASASPRRRELLEQIGLAFEVIPAKCGETVTKETPEEIVMELSGRKAREVASMIRDCPQKNGTIPENSFGIYRDFPGKNEGIPVIASEKQFSFGMSRDCLRTNAQDIRGQSVETYGAGQKEPVTPWDIMVIGADTIVACPGDGGTSCQMLSQAECRAGQRGSDAPRHAQAVDESGGKMPRQERARGELSPCRARILGKPRDEGEAYEMLSMLSGKTHSVYTGVSVLLMGASGRVGECTFSERTDVTVRELDGQEIRRYIASGEPMDKAGAYGIQGKFAIYIDKIDGDYNNVVGFPLAAFYREMKKLGIDLYSW